MTDTSAHIWIKDIKEEDDVKDWYLVKQKGMGTTRMGKPFINLVLADRTGELGAKVWDRAEQLSPLFQEGQIIRIKGRAGAYRGQVQITVADIELSQQEVDPSLFLESCTGDPSEMMKSLRKILKNVENSHLKALNERFLSDKKLLFVFGGSRRIGLTPRLTAQHEKRYFKRIKNPRLLKSYSAKTYPWRFDCMRVYAGELL